MFQFKQFSVNQANCAMKINTDGVLLGAMAESETPESILDIGTGTGVIALMLAQRFTDAKIDAVEIDELAAATASENFNRSVFSTRLKTYPVGFEAFFASNPEGKYDLIVSNPPFYINSLHPPKEKKQLAKHADADFFRSMLSGVSNHLTANGSCWLVLPLNTAELVKTVAMELRMFINTIIRIRSFENKNPHREMIVLSNRKNSSVEREFIIYHAEGVHSEHYRSALKDFFTIF